jgi:ATP-dependent Clp protease protease subunit
MMIHNPMTIAIGDTEEMEKAIAMLEEIKESIINAYELKTGLSRAKISHLMDAESWFNARKAVELGFADGILFMEDESFPSEFEVSGGMIFSRQAVTNSILQKLKPKEKPKGTPIESLEKRLFLLLPH